MRNPDVLVVGGGPIGSVAARYAAKTGARVLLVDEKDDSGDPARCAGLISLRSIETLGVSGESILREIHGVTVHSPNGKTVTIRSELPKAVVVDRGKLNRELVAMARDAGAEVSYHTQVKFGDNNLVSLVRNGEVIQVKPTMIVGADGPASIVGRYAGLPKPKYSYVAEQAIIKREPNAEDEVDVLFGNSLAPGFFAWAIPAEKGQLRVGLGTNGENKINGLLDKLLEERFSGEVISRTGGVIPIGYSSSTFSDGVIIVGDAAGQTKPTSGGGIYTGSLCAQIGGEVAGYAGLAGKTDRSTLAQYERRWKKEIGNELRLGLSARKMFSSLSDEQIDLLVGALDQDQVRALIAEKGDIDYPSRLLKEFIARKDLWPKLASFVPALGGWKEITKITKLAFSVANIL